MHAIAGMVARARSMAPGGDAGIAPSGSHFAEHGIMLWLGWIGASVAGELIGLTLVAAAGALLVAVLREPAGAAPAIAAALLLLAGFIEATAVATAQWLVVRHVFPSIKPSAWIEATAVGGATAWALGIGASVLVHREALAAASPFTIAGLTIAAGGALGALLGLAQWAVLRDHLARSGYWIAANAVGWSLGTLAAFRGMSCVGPCRTLLGAMGLSAATGLTSGIVAAVVTATALVALLRIGRRHPVKS